jgi:poly-gamma-glutamate capsule biosynthesis protein CapA/YwtB (metallophosphatase superfamily)
MLCHRTIFFFLIILMIGAMDKKVFGADVLTVIAVGDIMMGSTGQRGLLPPNDGQDLFDKVAPFLKEGDIVFGNLEGALSDEGDSKKCRDEKSPWCFEFKSPTRYGRYLKEAGFTVLNIANNHTLDFGLDGLKNTLETLKLFGLEPLGGKAIVELTIGEKKIALVGFSYQASPFSFSILEISKAKEIISWLKETHHLVVVSFHGGAEGKSALQIPNGREIFLGEDRGNVRQFAWAVIDAGADLVLGHGPHVLRALEIYKGKLIAYSLGNFLTYGMFNLKGPNGLSVILKVGLDPESGEFIEGRLIPVKLLNGGIPEWDESRAGLDLLKELIKKDGDRFNGRINDEGRISRTDSPISRAERD